MDWNTLLTASIPAVISYLVSRNQTNAKLKEIEATNNAELEKIKLTHELELQKLKEEAQINDQYLQNQAMQPVMQNLIGQIFSGEVSMEQVKKLSDDANSFKKN